MSSRFLRLAVACIVIFAAARQSAHAVNNETSSTAPVRVLRVAADPNNLPFSNNHLEGFENKIAAVIAKDLGARLEYDWHAQRRGFFRETLKADKADIVMGVPSNFEMAAPSLPYYHSSYVFVTRAGSGINVKSLDDPILRKVKVGVQLVGDDGANTPPAHALSRRGIIKNVKGFTLYGNYLEPNPPARIIAAVAKGEIDVAIAWGPMAGYFAGMEGVPLKVTPVKPLMDAPGLPMAYSISAGVRRGDKKLLADVNHALTESAPEIAKILDDYHVPTVAPDKVPSLPKEGDDD